MPDKQTRIVTIGGGSGQFALLSGLRNTVGIHLSAVVSMVDSGGSTGRLRDELGILPPGDILKCILALSPHRDVVRQLLLKRFERDRRLQGHNAGNMLLTMLSNYTGSFSNGVSALAEILDARGDIFPVTIDRATLVAELTDGTRLYGESAIDLPRGGRQRRKIKDVYLVPHHSSKISIHPPVVDAISNADHVILGPGDLFTSIIPNLVVPGMIEAITESNARLVFVLNIMTKYGETHGFSPEDFLRELEAHLPRPVDVVLCNARQPSDRLLTQYRTQRSDWVGMPAAIDPKDGQRIVGKDLLDTSGGIIRHDASKLAQAVMEAIQPAQQ